MALSARLVFPDGKWFPADFDVTPRKGQPVTVDGVRYVAREVGHLAIEQRRSGRRLAAPRRLVFVVTLEPDTGGRSLASRPVTTTSAAVSLLCAVVPGATDCREAVLALRRIRGDVVGGTRLLRRPPHALGLTRRLLPRTGRSPVARPAPHGCGTGAPPRIRRRDPLRGGAR